MTKFDVFLVFFIHKISTNFFIASFMEIKRPSQLALYVFNISINCLALFFPVCNRKKVNYT